jgi:Fur family ferric uptake transcriptional regulator
MNFLVSASYDVPGCPGDLRRLAQRGFTVEDHDVTLYGRCRDYARREMRVSR